MQIICSARYYCAVLAESYIHRLNPYVIQLTEDIGLRWYGLAYIAGFIAGLWFIKWMAKTGRSPLTPEQSGDVVFSGVMGLLLGGRIGYALFYDPSLLFGFSNSFPWWDLLAINQGGMASHGGIIGVLIALWLWGRKHKVSVLHLTDLVSVACTAGLFFGRIANFINAELWGKQLSQQTSAPWWSVKYPSEITEIWTQNPQQHAEKLQAIDQLRVTTVGGSESFYASVVAGANEGNAEILATIGPQLTACYPSQLFQAITDGPLLLATLVVVWCVPRSPGIVSGWFLITYGTFRIATEVFRQPDEGVSIIVGLSRGQLLSVAMLAAGGMMLSICSRKKQPKYGSIIHPMRASG